MVRMRVATFIRAYPYGKQTGLLTPSTWGGSQPDELGDMAMSTTVYPESRGHSYKEVENKRNEDAENTCANLPPFRLRPPFHDRELLFERGPLFRSSPSQ